MKYLLSSLIFLFSLAVWGQRVDPWLSLQAATQSQGRATEPKFIPLIIDYSEPTDIEAMQKMGIIVWHTRDNMALCCVPREVIGLLDNLLPESVRAISSAKPLSLYLDKALQATGVDVAHRGVAGEFESFTGQGVVAGLVDCGFDPGHSAFQGRVAHWQNINAADAEIINALEDGLETDTPKTAHATHVCGILAGSDPNGVYDGVATGPDIAVATCTKLYDVAILEGVESIIDHARVKGQPAVINLSLGSTIGPHDGSDAVCRYLDACSRDAVIVLASGNDGSNRVSLRHTFTAEAPTVAVGVESLHPTDLMLFNGSVDVWSSDAQAFEVRVKYWNRTTLAYDYVSQWQTLGPDVADLFKSFDSKEYEGTLRAAAGVSTSNRRYNAGIEFDFKLAQFQPSTTYSLYCPTVEFRGEEGSTLDAYIEGNIGFMGRSATAGHTAGTPDRSVSSMACGRRTVCVGSATTRDTAPAANGGELNWQHFVAAGTVSHFTSYGTLDDGRRLPHVCAPGAYIVSAASQPWLAAGPRADIVTTEPGNAYRAECGTSMATPHVAGVFALWLEADATLTPEDLRALAVETATGRGVDMTNPRSGAGMIDALGGLRKIMAGVIDPDDGQIMAWREGNQVLTTSPHATIEAYDFTGRAVNPNALPSAPVIVRLTTSTAVKVVKL